MNRLLLLLASIFFLNSNLMGSIYPVSLKERVDNSSIIALAKLKDKHAYWSSDNTNIYTLNLLEVTAFLKGNNGRNEIALISFGGRIGDKMQITFPSVQLEPGTEYLVFLNSENFQIDDKELRTRRPILYQAEAYACVQGVMKFQDGKYVDLLSEPLQSEEQLFSKIGSMQGGEKPRYPDGKIFLPRLENSFINDNRLAVSITSVVQDAGSTLSTNFVSGTIVTTEEMIINGSGFEATRNAGKVEFKNADDGGASWYVVPANSDYVSWSDTEIRVKIPRRAGTGNIRVTNDSGSSAEWTSGVTIDWAIIAVNSINYLFSEVTRQRIELIDDNGSGGYTFEYNTTQPNTSDDFAGNALAVAAFERSLDSWRCNTYVNFDRDNSGTTTEYANDGVNIVMFDPSLPSGVLGRATSYFYWTGSTSCHHFDTFWRTSEIDVQFKPDPPVTGYTWNFGPGASSGTQFDFESVSVHELGHGHGLGHVIQSSEVMHYSISNGSDKRTLSTDDIAAGNHKMSHSTAPNCIPTPSPMTALTAGTCSLLPIELLSFNGKAENGKARLTWATASELNNDYFTLDRSADGLLFKEMAVVPGAGTSIEERRYQWLDEHPLPGDNYYRLRQTDYDGKTTLSNVEVVAFEDAPEAFDIYPNPAGNGPAHLYFTTAATTGAAEVNIFNVSGNIVSEFTWNISPGSNKFSLPVDDFSDGIFLVQIIYSRSVKTLRFVKN
jgi:Matrixin/Secretion system C-terminal sorting domain